MSASQHDSNPKRKKQGVEQVLKNAMDFGIEHQPQDLTSRVKRIVAKLKDLSRRIDRISHNY